MKTVFATAIPTPAELKTILPKAMKACYKRNPVVKRKALIDEVIYGQCRIAPELLTLKHWNGDRKIDHMIDIAISNAWYMGRLFKMQRGTYTLTDKQFDNIM